MKATTLFLLAMFVAIAKAGDPIPGIDVSIVKSPGGGAVKTCKVDASGNFMCVGLSPGEYKVKLSGPGVMVKHSNSTVLMQECVITARDRATGMATGREGTAAPRDVATGQASGKRQYAPVRFTKVVDGDERKYTVSVTCSSDSIWGTCKATYDVKSQSK